ncbi:YheO-like protein [Burkholderia lata]|uniref:YheO-like protein n=1 Tax=Burkholderia lata (strain ATCC 17760 / DSM 23089 / LMG 22485 / NCIMB 9086 / R18194 / 383) TaxID=482957 RepID=A0A6P2K6H2_BURL3|nr:PAS domain-containing protein [Burkholderia lata]VWB51834.1 YheO-like protein [Burkholderia lata]
MSRAQPPSNGSTGKTGDRTKTSATAKRGKRPASTGQVAPHRAVADAIALLFQPYTEVVLHDLSTQTVAYVANNLSKREVGDDSALEEIGFDERENVIGPYEKLGWDGRKIRSISAVLRTESGEPVGVMCINFHQAALDQAKQALELLLSSAVLQPQPEKLFRDDWQDRVNVFLDHWLQERKLTLSMLTREHKRELVAALYAEGAFNGKSAANYVAKVLALGRATIFNYLKELRGEG